MNEVLKFIRVWRDDDGQAMTEFVIVIPVVVFVFALMLQTVFVAQVSQMMNYAAFIAARSYATSFSKEKSDAAGDAAKGHERAVEKAEFAANLAMAPISGAVQGEGMSVWNQLRSGFDGSSYLRTPATLYYIGEGMVISTFYRMKNFSLPKPAESDTAAVTCTFEYMCPIDVPGVTELWNYLFARDQMESDNLGDVLIEDQFDANRNNLVEGALDNSELSDLITTAEAALDLLGAMFGVNNFNAGLSSFLNENYASAEFMGAPLNIRLFAKSAVGMEPWNGSPMMPSNSEAPFSDPDFKKCEDEMAALEKAIDDQELVTSNVCADAISKSNTWVGAKNDLAACRARQATNATIDCSTEVSRVNSTFSSFKAREQDCKGEGEDLGNRNDDLANYECSAAKALAN